MAAGDLNVGGDINAAQVYSTGEVVPGVLQHTLATGVALASGVFTPATVGNAFLIDTEGAASSDDLTGIDMSVFPDLDAVIVFYMRTVSSTRDITVKNGSGTGSTNSTNVRTSTGADLVADTTAKMMRCTWNPRASDTGVVIVEKLI